jgi:hypothetical protein
MVDPSMNRHQSFASEDVLNEDNIQLTHQIKMNRNIVENIDDEFEHREKLFNNVEFKDEFEECCSTNAI